MAAVADDPKEVMQTEFRFHAIRRVRVHEDPGGNAAKCPTQKLALANNYGLLFVGGTNAVHCYKIQDLESADEVDKDTKKKELEFQGKTVGLPSSPTHLGLNADQTVLSIVVKLNDKPTIYMFDTRTFNDAETKPFLEIAGITPPGVHIREVAWNPVIPAMMAVVCTNGQLAMYLVKADPTGPKYDTTTLSPGDGISCISWSPKGKQLVVGKLNGQLVQYKPDLTVAKTMEPPQDGQRYAVMSLLWVSTYQFFACYKNTSDPDSRPGLYLVQGSKAGPTTYVNYDDICYSTGEASEPYFSLIPIPEWNLVIAASHNAMEIGVLGSADGQKWVQWMLSDAGRAELPLKANNDERYPAGLALGICTTRKLPLEDNQVMPVSMPVLFSLSRDGLLCGFYVVNQSPNAAQVTRIEPNPKMDNICKGTIQLPMAAAPPVGVSAAVKKPPEVPAFGTSFISSTPVKSQQTFAPVAKPPSTKPLLEVSSFVGTPEKSAVEVMKPQAQLPKVVDPPKQQGIEKSDSTDIQESFKKAIKEEILAFEQELALIKQKSLSTNIDIGTTEEKTALKVDCNEMEKFCSDLVDITSSQNQEIHDLQSKMLEAFELAEEAKSRDVRNKDPKYQRLLKARALDPLNQRRLSSVQSKHLYLEQQIDEANMKLDLEWEDHLENCKKGNNRMRRLETASKETLYRVLVNHTNIIESQKAILEKIEHQMKELKMRNVLPKVAEDNDKDLEKLSTSLLEKTKLKADAESPKTMSSPGFSPEKASALRQFLNRKGTNKVKPDPELSKSRSESVTKDSKSKSLVDTLKIADTKIKQTLNFVETPTKPVVKKQPEVITSPQVGLTPVHPKPTTSNTMPQAAIAKPTPVLSSLLGSPVAPNVTVTSEPAGAKTLTGFSFGNTSSKPSAPSMFGAVAPSTSGGISFGSGSSSMFSSGKVGLLGSAPTSSSASFSLVPPANTSVTSLPKTTAQEVVKTQFTTISTPAAAITPSTKPSLGTGFMTATPASIAPTTKAPSFGFTAATTTPSSVFGSVSSSTSVFGKLADSTAGSVFGSAPVAKSSSTPAPSAASTTASANAPTTTSVSTTTAEKTITSSSPASVFGSATTPVPSSLPSLGSGITVTPVTAAAAPATTTSSVFGAAPSVTASTSIFGKSSLPSASTSASPFATSVATAPSTTTAGSVSSTVTTTAPAAAGVFGNAASSSVPSSGTSTSTSIFGGGSSSSSIFGGTPSSSGSVFGTSAATATAMTKSVFGGSATTGSMFGGASKASPTSSAPTMFGGSASAAIPSNFGGVSSAVSTTASTTTSTSLFGAAVTTAASSVFGGKPSMFGDAASTASSSVFGSTPAATTSSSVFGTTSTSSSGTSVFGGGQPVAASTTSSSAFGGFSSTPPSSTPSAFGGQSSTQSSSTPSAFGGQSSSVFGSKPAFGAASTGGAQQGSVFGSTPATTSSSSVFGSSSGGGSLFGGAAASSATSGGGFFSGLGASPSAANANKNVFGGASAFGASTSTSSTTSQSLFGGTNTATTSASSAFGGGSGFGASNPQQSAFGSFSSPGGSIANQGFGFGQTSAAAPATSPAKPGGFGSPPAFGGQPAFGSAPAFGAAASPSSGFGASPAFGSGPTFGGGAAFGAASPQTGSSVFGASSSVSNAPTFGSIAGSGGAPTGGFGALAQQGSTFGSTGGGGGGGGFGSPPNQQQQPNSGAFGSSPSFGSSPAAPAAFSSWR